MAISRISSQDTNATGIASAVATYPAATQYGNLLIAIAGSNSATAPAISTSGWKTAIVSSGATANAGIFYKIALGSETTVTATGATQTDIAIFEFTGNANPAVLDGTAGFSAPSGLVTSKATPTITTTNANDLILSAALVLDAPSTSSGFAWSTSTLIGPTGGTDPRPLGGQSIVSTTQTSFSDTLSWTGGVNAVTLIAAFQANYNKGDTLYNHVIVGDGMSRSEVAN